DTLDSLADCQQVLENLHALSEPQTRLIVAHFSHPWYPALKLAEMVGLRTPQPAQNVLSPADVRSLAELADFEPVKTEVRMLTPARMLGLGRLLNRFV